MGAIEYRTINGKRYAFRLSMHPPDAGIPSPHPGVDYLVCSDPNAGNLGGGGFIVYRPAKGEPVTYDFREKAPAAASPTMWLKDGKYDPELHHFSHRAVGVPGTVAGLHLAWKEQGSRPWKELLQPAIRLARCSGGERVLPAQSREAGEVAVGAAEGQPVLDGERGLHRVDSLREHAPHLEVEEAARHVLDGQLQVEPSLPVAEGGVTLAGLDVDHLALEADGVRAARGKADLFDESPALCGVHQRRWLAARRAITWMSSSLR